MRKTYGVKLDKSPKKSFIDFYRDNRKWVPSSANYKVQTEAFAKLSASPIAMRTKRH